MLSKQEQFTLLSLILIANFCLFLVTSKSQQAPPIEEIYTVESVMAKLNQGQEIIQSSRQVASLPQNQVKISSLNDLVNETPKSVKELGGYLNSHSQKTWQFLMEECLSLSTRGCKALIAQVQSFSRIQFRSPKAQLAAEKTLAHLALLNCYISHRHNQNSKNDVTYDCEYGRSLAESYPIAETLGENFAKLCDFGLSLACIEKHFYNLKLNNEDMKPIAETELYGLCKDNYLHACELWIEYFLESHYFKVGESLLMHACALGQTNSCLILAERGSRSYSDRALYHLSNECLNKNKYCEQLIAFDDHPIVDQQRYFIYQKLCHRNYANFCHLLSIEEIKKYGLLAAKHNLAMRCDKYFRYGSNRCPGQNAKECEEFSNLCRDYDL